MDSNVTFAELFQFCTLLVSVISLVIMLCNEHDDDK